RGLVPDVADEQVQVAVAIDVGDCDAFGAERRVDDHAAPPRRDAVWRGRAGDEQRRGGQSERRTPTSRGHHGTSATAAVHQVRTGLVGRHHDDAVEVDVGRTVDREGDALGDVVGGEGPRVLVDL